jgi:prepilin-type N-terminal cleavage/methylation domain-containing protein
VRSSRAESRASARGHSLLELAVVLVVLAILLSSAWPSVARWSRRFESAAAARGLAADLARSRSAAVLRGETVTVSLDTLAGAWRATVASGDTILEGELGPGLGLTTTAWRQRVLFTARGTGDLYSTTWVGVPADPAARAHGLRVAPTGAIERR